MIFSLFHAAISGKETASFALDQYGKLTIG